MAEQNLERMYAQINEMMGAINSANAAMDMPVSDLHNKCKTFMKEQYFEPLLKSSAVKAKLATDFQRCISSGRLDPQGIAQTVTGIAVIGAALGTVTIGAAGIDTARNAIAKQKAKSHLLECYRELVVKQNELIIRQMKINKEIEAVKNQNQLELETLRNKRKEIDATLYKITEMVKKYDLK